MADNYKVATEHYTTQFLLIFHEVEEQNGRHQGLWNLIGTSVQIYTTCKRRLRLPRLLSCKYLTVLSYFRCPELRR